MTALVGNIGPSDAVLNFDSTISVGSYPAPFTLDSESIQIIGGSGSTQVSVVRGANGTAPASHADATALVSGWPVSIGGLTSATVDLTADDIATLHSVPVEVVAAQGADKIIVPIQIMYQSFLVTTPWSAGQAQLGVDGTLDLYGTMTGAPSSSFVSTFEMDLVTSMSDPVAVTALADQALLVSFASDPGQYGPILTSSIDTAGTGYAQGDTFDLGEAGVDCVSPAHGVVDTVLVNAIATYHFTNPGVGLHVDSYNVTATSGMGADGVISVDSITPSSDSTASVTVVYYVLTLAA